MKPLSNLNIKEIVSIQSIEELHEWDGQSPPTARTYNGKPVVNLQDVIGSGKALPNFGPYAKEKREKIAELKQKLDILGDNQLPNNRPAVKPSKPIPSVQEVIGRALDKIGTYSDLDNRLIHLYNFKKIGFQYVSKSFDRNQIFQVRLHYDF